MPELDRPSSSSIVIALQEHQKEVHPERLREFGLTRGDRARVLGMSMLISERQDIDAMGEMRPASENVHRFCGL